jgi:hypothetical protein
MEVFKAMLTRSEAMIGASEKDLKAKVQFQEETGFKEFRVR